MANNFERVYNKPSKRWGAKASNYFAAVTPRKSIDIYMVDTPGKSSFVIGDIAEYDSYNLRYLGEIVAIGKKTVTIKEENGYTNHRLSLERFCSRNYGIDIDKVREENRETMMYI